MRGESYAFVPSCSPPTPSCAWPTLPPSTLSPGAQRLCPSWMWWQHWGGGREPFVPAGPGRRGKAARGCREQSCNPSSARKELTVHLIVMKRASLLCQLAWYVWQVEVAVLLLCPRSTSWSYHCSNITHIAGSLSGQNCLHGELRLALVLV